MGGCSSSGHNTDADVDLFLARHHRAKYISTDKSCYEISKQQWNPTLASIKAKQVD